MNVVVPAVWIIVVVVFPLCAGFLFPRHGRAIALAGLVLAIGYWIRFWFGGTGGWSRGDTLAFGAVYLGVCLVVFLVAALGGRLLRLWISSGARS